MLKVTIVDEDGSKVHEMRIDDPREEVIKEFNAASERSGSALRAVLTEEFVHLDGD